MSGSLSYLPSLFGSSAQSSSSSLLGILYGQSGQAGAASAQNPITALQSAEKNQTKDIATTAAEPEVKRDVAAFRSAVTSAKNAGALLANPAVMKVLLPANGLADQIPYGALAKQALLSDPTDTKSLVNKLTDTRWKTAAQTYNFATQGLAVIQNPKVLDTIANAYAEVTWRQSLDASTPGLSNALSFRAQASAITSVDQILGDPTLRTVVTTALGIPKQIAFQELPAQEKAISSRVDISKFKDPKFVETFTQRYLLAAADIGSSASSTDLISLAVQSRGLVV